MKMVDNIFERNSVTNNSTQLKCSKHILDTDDKIVEETMVRNNNLCKNNVVENLFDPLSTLKMNTSIETKRKPSNTLCENDMIGRSCSLDVNLNCSLVNEFDIEEEYNNLINKLNFNVPRWNYNEFTLENFNEGFFGKIYKATHIHTKDLFVLKVLKDEDQFEGDEYNDSGVHGGSGAVDGEYKEMFLEEIKLLCKLNHPNILKCEGITYIDKKICYLSEFVNGGTLQEVIRGQNTLQLSWDDYLNIALDISKGMAYLHHLFIIHRDLNSKNIVMKRHREGKYEAIIIDFGLSYQRPDVSTPEDEVPVGPVGSPYHIAPELFHDLPCSQQTDVFSYGIILCEVISGCPGADPEELPRTNDFGLNVEEFSEMASDCPAELLNLAVRCCQLQSNLRPKFTDIVKIIDIIIDIYSDVSGYYDDSTVFYKENHNIEPSLLCLCSKRNKKISHKTKDFPYITAYTNNSQIQQNSSLENIHNSPQQTQETLLTSPQQTQDTIPTSSQQTQEALLTSPQHTQDILPISSQQTQYSSSETLNSISLESLPLRNTPHQITNNTIQRLDTKLEGTHAQITNNTVQRLDTKLEGTQIFTTPINEIKDDSHSNTLTENSYVDQQITDQSLTKNEKLIDKTFQRTKSNNDSKKLKNKLQNRCSLCGGRLSEQLSEQLYTDFIPKAQTLNANETKTPNDETDSKSENKKNNIQNNLKTKNSHALTLPINIIPSSPEHKITPHLTPNLTPPLTPDYSSLERSLKYPAGVFLKQNRRGISHKTTQMASNTPGLLPRFFNQLLRKRKSRIMLTNTNDTNNKRILPQFLQKRFSHHKKLTNERYTNTNTSEDTFAKRSMTYSFTNDKQLYVHRRRSIPLARVYSTPNSPIKEECSISIHPVYSSDCINSSVYRRNEYLHTDAKTKEKHKRSRSLLNMFMRKKSNDDD